MTVVDPDTSGPAAPVTPSGHAIWHSRARFRLANSGGRTAIVERTERGRLTIEEPREVPADGVCHLAVTYPPSGIASGERSRLRVDVTDAGRALLTTSGPIRLHRTAGPVSTVERQLTVSNSAALEWLPRESVVGSRTDAQVNTRVILEERARFLGWEIASLGRARDGSSVDDGRLQQRLEVRRAGEALVNERVIIDGGSIRTSTGETGGTAFGTLVAAGPDGVAESVAEAVLRSLTRSPFPGSVWHVSGALVVRIPAATAAQALEDLEEIWRRLRPLVVGREAGSLAWATS